MIINAKLICKMDAKQAPYIPPPCRVKEGWTGSPVLKPNFMSPCPTEKPENTDGMGQKDSTEAKFGYISFFAARKYSKKLDPWKEIFLKHTDACAGAWGTWLPPCCRALISSSVNWDMEIPFTRCCRLRLWKGVGAIRGAVSDPPPISLISSE